MDAPSSEKRSRRFPAGRPLAFFLLLALPLLTGVGRQAASQETTAGGPQAAPAPSAAPPVPQVSAKAWALVDLRTGEYLGGKEADKPLAMASTTKIMTALVTLDMVGEGRVGLDEEVTVSADAASYAVPAYSNVGLREGDVLSLRELLMATMISSGDDAAYALAEFLGEKGGAPGGGDAAVSRFVAMMNEKAKEMGLRSTHFENPVGFDARGHHTTARELVRMTRAAYDQPEFARIVGLRSATITTQDREIPLQNTNQLLYGYAPAVGVKTGTTPAAGPSLVSAASSGDESYAAVVLDDEARFDDSAALLEHGFEAYDRRQVVREGERYAKAPVPYRRGEEVGLAAKGAVDGLVGPGERVETRAHVQAELPGEARPGTPLGTVEAYVGGKKVGETRLVAAQGYEEASLFQKVWYTASGIFE